MNAISQQGLATRPPIFTRNFVFICLATFFSSGAQFLVLTAIPSLLTELGYSSGFVGGFVGAFGLGALIVRLPVGRGVDRFGPRTFALIGAGSMSAAYVLYAILSLALTRPALEPAVPFMLPLAGLAHSFGFSTYGTAAHSFVAYTAPKTRRGEAISYYGMLIDAARALGSGLSLAIALARGFSTLLVAAAVIALVAALLASNLRRAKTSPGVPEVPGVPTSVSRIESRVLAPALTTSTIALSGGATLAFIPLLGLERGITNPGIFFTVISLTSILIRVVAGRLIDRFGRIASIVPGMLLVTTGLLFVSRMSSIGTLVLAGLVYGVGFSTASIALQARAIDMSGPERQGAAMATYFAMVDLGVGLGSITAGQFASLFGYGGVFSRASLVPVIGLVAFLLYTWRHQAQNPDLNDYQQGDSGSEIGPVGNPSSLPGAGG
jgi:MFS family permease